MMKEKHGTLQKFNTPQTCQTGETSWQKILFFWNRITFPQWFSKQASGKSLNQIEESKKKKKKKKNEAVLEKLTAYKRTVVLDVNVLQSTYVDGNNELLLAFADTSHVNFFSAVFLSTAICSFSSGHFTQQKSSSLLRWFISKWHNQYIFAEHYDHTTRAPQVSGSMRLKTVARHLQSATRLWKINTVPKMPSVC